MSFSDQITKNHLLKAIESIDEKGLQGYPNSSTYDIIYNEKRYPPKTVIAIASELVDGIKIKTTSFNGGEKTKAFKVLDENGFKIETKKLKEDQTENALIDYVQTFENWKWCEEFFQILGHLINRINFVNNDPRIAFTLVKKKKRISINVGGRLVFAIYRTNDENWFWFVLNEADTEKARTLSEYMIGGREEKFASGTAALLIPFKPGLSDKSMNWIINAWIKAVEDQMPSVKSAGQPEKHNDFIYKAAIDIEYRTQLLKKIGKPMKPFKIYKIAESASPNSQILIAPKRKYFYWDNKDFKKNKIGDLVIFINLTKRQALWTEINVLGIKTDFNDITKKTSFTHNNEPYEVDGNGKWNEFIQFKILTEQAIPQDWNWTKQIGASSVYDLWKTGIEKHKDRIDKINDLKGIFHEKNEVKIMDDYIIKLEESLNRASNSKEVTNKKTQRKIWWVCQGDTFKEKQGKKYLWAPIKDKNGVGKIYWKNMEKVSKGDIIFNYSEGLKGVSIAQSKGYPSENPNDTDKWEKKGNKVDIELYEFSSTLSFNAFVEKKDEFQKLLTGLNGPFNVNGKVKQGYLFEFNREAGKLVFSMLEQNTGNIEIDNYFKENPSSKEKIITTLFPPQDFEIKSFQNACENSGLVYTDELITRFVSSLVTKPFVILTGLSGSGKTKLAQSLAQWICEDQKQYCIVPVGADWTNREPLLGYINALDNSQYILPENGALQLIIESNKYENQERPFFLILDEMNLSHVERYFADFLSVMESKDKFKLHSDKEYSKSGVPHELSWPKNLFVIGTVNIDETTYMFSPKVLDRANVIEFRVNESEIKDFLNSRKEITPITKMGATMSSSFVSIAKSDCNESNFSTLNLELLDFFKELQVLGAEFGYRTGTEIQNLFSKIELINPEYSDKVNEKIDIAIMQKLLPKIHGSRRKLLNTLNLLAQKCLTENQESIFNERGIYSLTESNSIKYMLSFEKIARMYKNAIENGFASYAEA